MAQHVGLGLMLLLSHALLGVKFTEVQKAWVMICCTVIAFHDPSVMCRAQWHSPEDNGVP